MKNTNDKGFTLLETLVAVTILILSIVAPMYAANRALVAAEISRDQLVASSFAQEGIEQTLAVRDYYYLKIYPNTATAWTDFKTAAAQCYVADSSCKIDYKTHEIGRGPLASSFTNGGISYSRAITFQDLSDTEIKVTSTVTWKFRGNTQTVSISDHLTSWQ